MRVAVLLAMLVAPTASAVAAQTPITIPGYSSTYSGAAHTRGMLFLAPAPFTIVALKVPDDQNNGKQNVAVFRCAGKPPAYSATATGGLRFASVGQSSSLWINCFVPFNKGDWVGILGACGDGSMMYNSYGAGGFVTTINGAGTTLFRFLSQTNLTSMITSKTPIPYSDGGTGSIGRVQCAVMASPDLQAKGDGSIGTTLSFSLSAPADRGLNYQMGTSFSSGPIPLGARRIFLGIDKLMELSMSGLAPGLFKGYAGGLDTSGMAAASINVPRIAALKGTRLVTAYVTLRAAAPLGINSISGSHELTIP